MIDKSDINKVVLAYSGGLIPQSFCQFAETHACEVVTFTADLGQGEELNRRGLVPKRWALKKFILKICARNLSAIMSFRCFAPMRFMKAFICWAPRLRGH